MSLKEWIEEFLEENRLMDEAGFSPWEWDEEKQRWFRRGWGKLECKHPGYNGEFTIE